MPIYPIQAPRSIPKRHSLLASAFPAPEDGLTTDGRWELGFGFTEETSAEPETRGHPCVGGAGSPGVGSTITPATNTGLEWAPYQVRAPYRCDTRTFADFVRRARDIYMTGESKFMERELWSGGIVGWQARQGVNADAPNLSLAADTATPLAAGSTVAPKVAIRELLAAAADAPGGPQCMIHGSSDVVMAWRQNESVIPDRDGRLVTTVDGHIVVSGAGYSGEAPGMVVPPAGVKWAYITTPVYVIRAPEIQVIDQGRSDQIDIDPANNYRTVIAQRTVCAYWDGVLHAGVAVDTTGD